MSQTVLLEDVCIQITDGAHWSPPSRNEGKPMASVKDMSDYNFKIESCRKISEKDYQELVRSGCQPEKNDVLIAKDGSYLKHIFVFDGQQDIVLLSSIAIIKPNLKIIDPYYLAYYVRNQRNNDDMSQYVSGAAIPRIVLKNFGRLPVKLPDIALQRKIVSILRSLDEQIELNQQTNKTLEQIGRVLFKHYFIDNPEAKTWPTGKLGDFLKILESGSRPKGGAIATGIPSIGAENIEGLGIYDYSKEKYISRTYASNINRGRIESEDVLLYKDGAYVGKKSMFMDNFPHKICFVNEHVFRLRTNEKLPSQPYLYFWLDQQSITKMIIDSGIKAAQPGINQENVKNLPILIPPIGRLKDFNQDLKPFLKNLFLNANQIRKLTLIRDLILPRLISGRIKI